MTTENSDLNSKLMSTVRFFSGEQVFDGSWQFFINQTHAYDELFKLVYRLR